MIPGIVLAAGDSSRMGRPKALLPIGRETFLERVTRVLKEGGVEDVLVVVGRDADAIADAVPAHSTGIRLIENPDPSGGQLSSLLVGLSAVDRPGVQAVLVTLIDVPLITADTVRSVLAACRRRTDTERIFRPARGDKHGHPVVFDRTLFDELRHADPGRGAKSVIEAHQRQLVHVEVAGDGAFIDIDTPEDYARFIEGPGAQREP